MVHPKDLFLAHDRECCVAAACSSIPIFPGILVLLSELFFFSLPLLLVSHELVYVSRREKERGERQREREKERERREKEIGVLSGHHKEEVCGT